MIASALLEIVVMPDNDFGFVLLRGALDIGTSSMLRAPFLELAQQGARDVIVDLRDVDYIDSTGLSALIVEQKRVSQRDRHLRLVVASGAIERLLRITGLIATFAVYWTLEDARQDSGRIASLVD